MTILLTGATGFVGRQVHTALVARHVPVRVVIRAGTDARLVAPVESVVSTPDLFAERAEWWRTACTGIHTVVHVAWIAEPGNYLHSQENQSCLHGTLELAHSAVDAGARRFVGIGSCFEYDVGKGYLSTRTPLAPRTPYASAKADAFRALTDFLLRSEVSFAWCRLFYLYGEGENERRLVPYLRRQLSAGHPAEMTHGDQVRDYLDVQEAGAMIADVSLGGLTGPINICSGVAVTVRALAERIADEYGRRDLLHFGARPDNAFDPPFIVGVR